MGAVVLRSPVLGALYWSRWFSGGGVGLAVAVYGRKGIGREIGSGLGYDGMDGTRWDEMPAR